MHWINSYLFLMNWRYCPVALSSTTSVPSNQIYLRSTNFYALVCLSLWLYSCLSVLSPKFACAYLKKSKIAWPDQLPMNTCRQCELAHLGILMTSNSKSRSYLGVKVSSDSSINLWGHLCSRDTFLVLRIIWDSHFVKGVGVFVIVNNAIKDFKYWLNNCTGFNSHISL